MRQTSLGLKKRIMTSMPIINEVTDFVRKNDPYFIGGTAAGLVLGYVGLDYAIKKSESHVKLTYKKSLIPVETAAKKEVQDNASKNKKEEQNNDAKNRLDEIRAQSEADLAKISADKEAKKEVIGFREKCRNERNQKVSTECDEPVESYAEAKANGHLTNQGDRCLGFPYFKVGYSRAFVGPTDVGKTTYLLQEGTAVARGECLVPLTADWHPIPPVHVVYFSLEQTYEELEQHWGAEIESVKSHFHLYCGQYSPAQIVKTVKEYLEISNEYGVVLYIDNEGKLEEYASFQEIVQMTRELEHIRTTARNDQHPLTTVKIFHAHSGYDETKKFTISCVRGDKKNVNLNNNVMFIAKTCLGEDKRMVGFLKNKHGKKDYVNIVEFAGTEVDQFRYVGQAKEVDVLCSKTPKGDCASQAVVFNPHKPGRKPTITYDEAAALQATVTSGEKTWKQIEEETGHSKSKVKECIRAHKRSEPPK